MRNENWPTHERRLSRQFRLHPAEKGSPAGGPGAAEDFRSDSALLPDQASMLRLPAAGYRERKLPAEKGKISRFINHFLTL